jgi:hypothetical protein
MIVPSGYFRRRYVNALWDRVRHDVDANTQLEGSGWS